MATVSAHRLSEFKTPYTKMAHELCWSSPGAYGGLFGILGPLRSDSDHGTGLRYLLEHERSSYDPDYFGEEVGRRSSRIRAHNLDFTLPTIVRVFGDDVRQAMPISSFVTELFTALGEDQPNEHGVMALSTAIRAEHEKRLLEGMQGDLRDKAKRYAGKNAAEVDDAGLQILAVDVALRQANLALINSEMRDHVRAAHDIARTYPGTARELLRDSALRAITRPEQQVGQYAMDPETASSILWETASIGTIGE